ncbi:acyl-CoA dehydrogenase family protein [Gordonia polyisoprenivorans]|uniref:acyl-CoA dehydrogenase family protein n=1 Tax=Gordonia polyisoprenivorans TaxID=84595 RepID=UPI001AD74B70|nr:acyl-CoA dehydrogenase family protein [Gordonia polyisoprenivorans]QTI69932.1 acyl-CoA dehydrogenase family protein [Gordonia polyisoprenivorans]
MNLDLEPREAQFRERLTEWLDGVELPEGLRDYGATPTGDDIPAGRAWQRALVDGGWAALSWPEPYGAGATVAEQAIFAETLARRHLPRQLSFVSMELAGPILISFGTEQQKKALLEPLRRGDEVWCQLFSEPGAGSDLAAISTKAVAADDGWRVSGQKVWTSGAHYAQYGLLLARTDSAQERHRGLSCFAVPMDRPGIEVRPILQMDGESKFNEVFLDDVAVGPDDLLGEVGGGWAVAMSILGRERRMLGSLAIGLSTSLTDLRSAAEQRGIDDVPFRRRWAELFSRVQLLRWTWFRLLSSATDSATDPRMSVLKLTSSELQQEVAGFGADTLGREFLTGADGEPWRHAFLASHGATLAGGTSEVQRNILGERVLRLPR